MLLTCSILFGLTIGSFLNVVVLRGEEGTRITGRSRCPHCGHTLSWYELLPVVSYLAQRGRCRACRVRLSLQYPAVELTTAGVFALVTYHVTGLSDTRLFAEGFSLETWLTLVVALAAWATLVAITVYDLRTQIIPDRFNGVFAVLSLTYALLAAQHSPLDLAAGPVLFLPLYLLWKVSDGRWIGLGDGKLAVGIGWLLGLVGGGSAVMFAFWIGALVALGIMAAQHMAAQLARRPHAVRDTPYTLKSEIPFGPFLVLGTAVVYFTGITMATLFWV